MELLLMVIGIVVLLGILISNMGKLRREEKILSALLTKRGLTNK